MNKTTQEKKQIIQNIISGACTRLIAALPCQQYQIFTLPAKEKRLIVSQHEFKDKILEITLRYWEYEHIFFRPDDCRYILIDDLTLSNLDELRKAHKVNAVVESSPNNYQAWLYIDVTNPDPNKCEYVQSALVRIFGGDSRSNGRDILGRMPETRNKKPEYQMSNGYFPFSKLKFPTNLNQITIQHDHLLVDHYNFSPIRQSEEPRHDISQNILENSTPNSNFNPTSLFSADDFYIEAITEMKHRLEGHNFDRSYIDCAIATSMHRKYGYSKIDIKNTLLKLSEKANERINKEGYITSIIKSIKNSQIQILDFNFILN